jgi:hypothetical protein
LKPKTNTKKTAPANAPRSKKKEVAAPAPVVNTIAPPAPARHIDVRQRAMLVNLTVHQWLANTTDSKITEEVATKHGITGDMGRYQKSLLSKPALEKMRSMGNKMRATHNRFTLPWDEWGTRILSAKAYLTYNTELTAQIRAYEQLFRDEFEAIGDTGKTKYAERKAEAKALLNGAFREADYPTLESLRSKFGAKVSVFPVPAGEDFRIDLGAEETAQVRKEIEAKTADRVTEAMDELYGRLKGRVSKLVEALKAEQVDGVRKDLFTGIQALLDTLPILNVTGDTQLEAFGVEIGQVIAGLDAKVLRETPAARADVLKQADAILSKMNDFLG